MLNLPSSIMEDILSRLPPKTIFICRTVCKSWLNLISLPHFSRLHLSRSPSNLLLYHFCIPRSFPRPSAFKFVNFEDSSYHHHDLTYEPSLDLDIQPNFTNTNLTLVGSVHGLVCLFSMNGYSGVDTVYIFNPTTREYITLPEAVKGLRKYPNLVTYGLGLDPLRMEYKIVRIYQVETYYPDRGTYDYTSEVQVYTLGTRSWRSAGFVKLSFGCREFGVYFQEKLHWLAWDVEGNETICFIDMHNESSHTFSTAPGYNKENCPSLRSLGVLGNHLCVCDNNAESHLDIWVMKDQHEATSSWSKEIVINITPQWDWICYQMVHVLKVFQDGEILFQWWEDMLFTYHPEKKTLTKIEYFRGHFWASPHISSLLSLNNFETEVVNSL